MEYGSIEIYRERVHEAVRLFVTFLAEPLHGLPLNGLPLNGVLDGYDV